MNHSTKQAGHGTPAAFDEQDYGRYCVGILCSTPYQRVSGKFDTLAEANAELDRLQPQHHRSLSVARMPTLAEQADYAITLRGLIAADRLEEAEVTA
jgi:hypothetical protein